LLIYLISYRKLVRKCLEIWESPKHVNSEYSENFTIRAKWKLAQILLKLGGGYTEEGEFFYNQACAYIKEHLGVELTLDTPRAQDVVDRLVFYWNR
jgi:hypothetical protein